MILKSDAGLTWSASAIPGDSELHRGISLFQGEGGGGVLLTRDVPEMVDHIVQEVLDECQDRELLTIRPNPTS
jgi:hypothetical protein